MTDGDNKALSRHYEMEMDFNSFSYSTPEDPFFKKYLIRTIEKLTGQFRIWRIYRAYLNDSKYGKESFWTAAIKRLKVDVRVHGNLKEAVPKEGPVVVVANHPFGVLDGLVLCYLLERVRPDFKILTNSVLTRSPEVKDNLLPIDFAETKEALETNLASRKAAREALNAGGCIGVFPAGGVSTIPNWSSKIAEDAPWQSFIGQLISQSEATVVPLYFEGQNSMIFQWASLLSMTLRLSLFFKELADRIGRPIDVYVGGAIKFSELPTEEGIGAILAYIRKASYELAEK